MEKNILTAIKQSVKKKYPKAKVILYGSRARGTAKPDSDWDLLILLDKDKITHDIEESVTYPLYDLEIELGTVISPMVYLEREWRNKYHVASFYKNIMKDGKQL